MKRIWENRGKAGRSGEPRAGEPRGKIVPPRMDPMDGAALWMHPHGRTDGAIQGINLIWEVPGNQPNPGRNMPRERIMAPAQMTAGREQPIPDPVSDPIPVLPACVPGKE